MTNSQKILSVTAALTLLICGTAGKCPPHSHSRYTDDAAQMQNLIASLSAMPAPDEPFETLRYNAAEQQLYCDDIPVGQSYGGFSVHDGTVTVSAQSLGLNEQADLTPEQANASAGITFSEDADGLTLSSPFAVSRLIVRCEGEPANAGQAQSVTEYRGLHILQYSSPAEAYSAYQQYQADNRVSMVQPDQLYHVAAEPCSIPVYDKDDAVGYIGADKYCTELLSEKDTLPEVTVAVLDTGLDTEHGWFEGRIADGCLAMMKNDPTDYFYDGYGHGTHCAGIIAQSTTDNVKILPVKVINDRGYGYDSSIYFGILYAMEQGADVINMSLGGNGESWLIDEGIAALTAADIPCVVAAGNECENAKYHHPAKNPDCITVSAVENTGSNPDNPGNPNFQLALFSNSGMCIDFCAPGCQIQSAVPDASETHNALDYYSGTSMATPFVSAAYADLLSYDPTLSAADIYAYLKANAIDLGTEGFDPYFGWGMISLDGILPLLRAGSVPVSDDPPVSESDFPELKDIHLDAPNEYGEFSTIQTDVPFVHSGSVYSYYFTLEQDCRLSLQSLSGKSYSGKVRNIVTNFVGDISDTQPAELESGTYTLEINQKPSYDASEQDILTLKTEALSIYMADITPLDAYYTGEPITPRTNITLNGKQLYEGIDYCIIDSEPIDDISTRSFEVMGIGRYYDERSFTFSVLPAKDPDRPLLTEGSHIAEIPEAADSVCWRWIPEAAQYCFHWEDNRPGSIRIYDASGELTASLLGPDTQYMTADVIQNAEYTVCVSLECSSLTGNIPFSLTSDFRMLEDCTVRMPERITVASESAEPPMPEYEIYDGSKKLTEGTDFEVFAQGCETQYGLAEIVFRGIGRYCGITEQFYEICPASPNLLPANLPTAYELPLNLNVTALRNYPGTLRLLRFAAPSDGTYRLILPDFDSSGISTFVYDMNGELMPADQTDFTLKSGEAVQILCVTTALATGFEAQAPFRFQVIPLSNDTYWESDGFRWWICGQGTAFLADADIDAYGGIRIPETVIHPVTGETIQVGGIDSALQLKLAGTHTIYGEKGGNTESLCEYYLLCYAADPLPEVITGDLTGDGIVTEDDLLTLSRILSECKGMIVNASVEKAADCNQDGELNILDLQAMCGLMAAAEQS